MTRGRTVDDALIHPKAGGEIEARYTTHQGEVYLMQVRVGGTWVQPERILLPHVIADAKVELEALEAELAGQAQDDRELQRFAAEAL